MSRGRTLGYKLSPLFLLVIVLAIGQQQQFWNVEATGAAASSAATKATTTKITSSVSAAGDAAGGVGLGGGVGGGSSVTSSTGGSSVSAASSSSSSGAGGSGGAAAASAGGTSAASTTSTSTIRSAKGAHGGILGGITNALGGIGSGLAASKHAGNPIVSGISNALDGVSSTFNQMLGGGRQMLGANGIADVANGMAGAVNGMAGAVTSIAQPVAAIAGGVVSPNTLVSDMANLMMPNVITTMAKPVFNTIGSLIGGAGRLGGLGGAGDGLGGSGAAADGLAGIGGTDTFASGLSGMIDPAHNLVGDGITKALAVANGIGTGIASAGGMAGLERSISNVAGRIQDNLPMMSPGSFVPGSSLVNDAPVRSLLSSRPVGSNIAALDSKFENNYDGIVASGTAQRFRALDNIANGAIGEGAGIVQPRPYGPLLRREIIEEYGSGSMPIAGAGTIGTNVRNGIATTIENSQAAARSADSVSQSNGASFGLAGSGAAFAPEASYGYAGDAFQGGGAANQIVSSPTSVAASNIVKKETITASTVASDAMASGSGAYGAQAGINSVNLSPFSQAAVTGSAAAQLGPGAVAGTVGVASGSATSQGALNSINVGATENSQLEYNEEFARQQRRQIASNLATDSAERGGSTAALNEDAILHESSRGVNGVGPEPIAVQEMTNNFASYGPPIGLANSAFQANQLPVSTMASAIPNTFAARSTEFINQSPVFDALPNTLTQTGADVIIRTPYNIPMAAQRADRTISEAAMNTMGSAPVNAIGPAINTLAETAAATEMVAARPPIGPMAAGQVPMWGPNVSAPMLNGPVEVPPDAWLHVTLVNYFDIPLRALPYGPYNRIPWVQRLPFMGQAIGGPMNGMNGPWFAGGPIAGANVGIQGDLTLRNVNPYNNFGYMSGGSAAPIAV